MYSVKLDENNFFQGIYAKIGKVEGGTDIALLPPKENELCYYYDSTTNKWIFSQEKYNELEAQRIADEEAEKIANAKQKADEEFVQNLPEHVKQQRADIDYIALMSGVILDDGVMTTGEYSYKYHDIKNYYDTGLWNSTRVYNMVGKNVITKEEYTSIIGKEYI